MSDERKLLERCIDELAQDIAMYNSLQKNEPVAWMFTYYSRSPEGPEITESITQCKEWLDAKVKEGSAKNIRPLFTSLCESPTPNKDDPETLRRAALQIKETLDQKHLAVSHYLLDMANAIDGKGAQMPHWYYKPFGNTGASA